MGKTEAKLPETDARTARTHVGEQRRDEVAHRLLEIGSRAEGSACPAGLARAVGSICAPPWRRRREGWRRSPPPRYAARRSPRYATKSQPALRCTPSDRSTISAGSTAWREPLPARRGRLPPRVWEGRVFAMTSLVWRRLLRHRRFRHAIEHLDAVAYLADGYRTLARRHRAAGARCRLASDTGACRGPSRGTGGDQPPRFAVGDAVQTRNLAPGGPHAAARVRARTLPGTVTGLQGGWVLPDTNAHGEGECPDHVCGLRLEGRQPAAIQPARHGRAPRSVRELSGAPRVSGDHEHDAKDPREIRAEALEQLLTEQGASCRRRTIDAILDTTGGDVGPMNSARAVARAWVDPGLPRAPARERHRHDRRLGLGGAQGERLVVVETRRRPQRRRLHGLSSCYPWRVLFGSPARVVKDPSYRSAWCASRGRSLSELGLELPDEVEGARLGLERRDPLPRAAERHPGPEPETRKPSRPGSAGHAMIGVARVERQRARAHAPDAGATAPPRANGGLVFAAPWEDRISASPWCSSGGAAQWPEFQAPLIAAITGARPTSGETDPGPYGCWLEAFRFLAAATGSIDTAALAALESGSSARPAGHDH